MHVLEVEIDASGNIQPVDATVHLPIGRATLVWDSTGSDLYRLAESSFSDWLTPEEDEAWAYLQRDK